MVTSHKLLAIVKTIVAISQFLSYLASHYLVLWRIMEWIIVKSGRVHKDLLKHDTEVFMSEQTSTPLSTSQQCREKLADEWYTCTHIMYDNVSLYQRFC